MGVEGSLSPPSSSINLDLTLSLALPKKQETQEPRKGDTKSIKLFGFTINVLDHVQETPTAKTQHKKPLNFCCKRAMHDDGGDIVVGVKNSGQKNPVQAVHVKGRCVKELTQSDVNGCCRFMLKKQFVKDNVIPCLSDAERKEVHSDGGYSVPVVDVDTRTQHLLKFKVWKSANTFVFTEWSQNFVKRRNLQKGDRISLSWDGRKFYFSVLQRAPNNH